jgi:plastocyanin
MTRPASWLLAAGAAVLLAGCAAGPVNTGPPVATDTVDLPPSYRFEPAAITVPAGTTVTWTNNDNFTHNVQFGQDEPLTMRPGESVSHAFSEPGTYDYVCSLHPRDMQGSVLVTAD